MDNRAERLRIEKGELRLLIEEKLKRKLERHNIAWVSIDEAQKCPALFEQVKALYDEFKDQHAIKFILTGSGFLELHQLSAESLAGRIELFYLQEFGLQESIRLHHQVKLPKQSLFDVIDKSIQPSTIEKYVYDLAPLKPLLSSTLDDLLIWGGLPEVLNHSDNNMRLSYLANYLQTYLEKDIRAINTITDINLYHQLIDVIAQQTGSIREDKKIIDALSCNRDTLKKYRGFLMATLVYKEIHPFIAHSLKRLVKSPKGYLLNNGLITYLTGIDNLNVLKKSGLIGHRFENWFLNELNLWLSRDVRRSEIYFWRTSNGAEVDFVVKKAPKLFPFEATYSAQVQPKKLKNLVQFMQDYPQAEYGFYIYLGDFHIDTKNKIIFVPAWAVG